MVKSCKYNRNKTKKRVTKKNGGSWVWRWDSRITRKKQRQLQQKRRSWLSRFFKPETKYEKNLYSKKQLINERIKKQQKLDRERERQRQRELKRPRFLERLFNPMALKKYKNRMEWKNANIKAKAIVAEKNARSRSWIKAQQQINGNLNQGNLTLNLKKRLEKAKIHNKLSTYNSNNTEATPRVNPKASPIAQNQFYKNQATLAYSKKKYSIPIGND